MRLAPDVLQPVERIDDTLECLAQRLLPGCAHDLLELVRRLSHRRRRRQEIGEIEGIHQVVDGIDRTGDLLPFRRIRAGLEAHQKRRTGVEEGVLSRLRKFFRRHVHSSPVRLSHTP